MTTSCNTQKHRNQHEILTLPPLRQINFRLVTTQVLGVDLAFFSFVVCFSIVAF